MTFCSYIKNRKTLTVISLLVIIWSIAIGDHEHDITHAAELSDFQPQREFFYELTNNSIELKSIDIQPNEIIDLLIKDLSSEQHAFIFTGIEKSQYEVLSFKNGVYRIRLRVLDEGELMFYCAIPNHEDIHGVIRLQ